MTDILDDMEKALALQQSWRDGWREKRWPDSAPPDGALSTKSVGEIEDGLRALVTRCREAERELADVHAHGATAGFWGRAASRELARRKTAEKRVARLRAALDAMTAKRDALFEEATAQIRSLTRRGAQAELLAKTAHKAGYDFAVEMGEVAPDAHQKPAVPR